MLGVHDLPGQLGNQIAPGHGHLDPAGGVDGKAITIAESVVLSVNEFQSATAGGAIALDPEAEARVLVPVLPGIDPGGEELGSRRFHKGKAARLTELAIDQFHRARGNLGVGLGGDLPWFVLQPGHVEQEGRIGLTPRRREEGETSEDEEGS